MTASSSGSVSEKDMQAAVLKFMIRSYQVRLLILPYTSVHRALCI